MSKFSIGDIVKVISLNTRGYRGTKTIGSTGKITDSNNNGASYKLDGEGISCYLLEEDLTLDYPNPPHKHAKLIKAWADGAEIQFLNSSEVWEDTPEPTWYVENNYRIKPNKSEKELKLEQLEKQARQLADDIKELKNS